MTPLSFRRLGAALVLIGAIKAWGHSQAAGLLRLPSCFGDDVLVRVDVPLWHQVHCWGCYVALAGLAIILPPIVQRRLLKSA
ncbi:MAG: hypothetical protein AAFO63_02450 [Pseudomonadota bacterium]